MSLMLLVLVFGLGFVVGFVSSVCIMFYILRSFIIAKMLVRREID